MRAMKGGKLNWSSNLDKALISRGFSNWKDASVKIANHEKSNCHQEAVLKTGTIPATTSNVAEILSTQHIKDKRRQCFLKILSNGSFARQVLALRGGGDECDSNFTQLLKLRAEDDERLKEDCLHSADYFSIMIDETTDCSTSEQVVICCRWIDRSLKAHEDFMGLYQVGSTQAPALLQVIKDFLLRYNLSISKLRGQCYDGAASMCGSRNGVATQMLKEENRALLTHCYGYSLNLAGSDTMKQ